jgi:porin
VPNEHNDFINEPHATNGSRPGKKTHNMKSTTILAVFCLLMGAVFVPTALAQDATSSPGSESGFFSRPQLTGNWGGSRDWLDAHGVTIEMNGIYTLQTVVEGGANRGDQTGNLFSGDLSLKLETSKAGLWPGGFLSTRIEGRAGDSVLRRAGATSPVNNDALAPLVPGKFGDDTWALTELVAMQFLSEQFGLMGGLINTTSGDANPIAGSLISNAHFFNTGFLYSPVELAEIPTVTPGGGVIFLPTQNIQGSLIVVGSTETAGENPFDGYDGTTFSSEWTFKYQLGQLPGGMTIGGLYSINQSRSPLTEDPRILIQDVLAGNSIKTNKDSWAVYWNGFQYIQGDEKRGWGVFGRFGVSDGDPNPIAWSMAAGIGGVGLLPVRDKDRWGVGIYHLQYTNKGLIDDLGIDHETGGEVFYNMEFTPWMHVTLDAQVVDSAIPGVDMAFVLGSRVAISF